MYIYTYTTGGNNTLMSSHTLLLDWTVASLRPDQVPVHASSAGSAAAHAAAEKHKKYEKHHEMGKEHLVAMAVETHGLMCREGRQFLKKVADAADPSDSGDDERRHSGRAQFIRGLRERIAVMLQRGNAAVIRAWASTCVNAYVDLSDL